MLYFVNYNVKHTSESNLIPFFLNKNISHLTINFDYLNPKLIFYYSYIIKIWSLKDKI